MKMINKLEKLHCLFLIQGEHHNIINNKQICLKELVVFKTSRSGNFFHYQGFCELLHGPEVGLISFLQGIKTKTSSDQCFSETSWSHQYHIKILFEPLAFSKLHKLLFTDATSKRVVILIQVVIDRQLSRFGSALQIPLASLVDLHSSGEERCTFLFAKNRTSVFAKNCTLLFPVYKGIKIHFRTSKKALK